MDLSQNEIDTLTHSFVSETERGIERKKEDPFFQMTATYFFKALLTYIKEENPSYLDSSHDVEIFDYDGHKIKDYMIHLDSINTKCLSDTIIALLKEKEIKTRFTVSHYNMSVLDLRLAEFCYRNPDSEINKLLSSYRVAPSKTLNYVSNVLLKDFLDFCKDTSLKNNQN